VGYNLKHERNDDGKIQPFERSIAAKIAVSLTLANALMPMVDRQHPMVALYKGVVFLFEGWIQWIGWVMHLTDPLLPRTFTLTGTANFIFSTAVTVLVFLLMYWTFVRAWETWCRPWLREKGVFAALEKTIRHPLLLYTFSAGMALLLLASVWRIVRLL